MNAITQIDGIARTLSWSFQMAAGLCLTGRSGVLPSCRHSATDGNPRVWGLSCRNQYTSTAPITTIAAGTQKPHCQSSPRPFGGIASR